MHLKYYLIVIATTVICVNCELRDIEEMYLNFFVQIESVKKSIDILKLRMDALNEKNPNSNYYDLIDNRFSQVFENFRITHKSLDHLAQRLDTISANDKIRPTEEGSMKETLEISNLNEKYSTLLVEVNRVKNSEESLKQKNAELESKYLDILKNYEISKQNTEELKLEVSALKMQMTEILGDQKAVKIFENKPLFDVRIDKLPKFKHYCYSDPKPVDCKTATRCTQKSGYYNLTLPGNKSKQIMVFCDTKTNGGDWLHILRRHDGSENFTRPWLDYVKGFGHVEGEYWLGLENLHTLTNYNGRQQLYVYIENFEGESRFAHYDNFVVGSSSDQYELKSLGNYDGTAGEDMSYNVGLKFSTIDKDNDNWPTGSCAIQRQVGWWYNYCSFVQPTGHYLHGESSRNGILWRGFNGLTYSHKVMY
ncbi:angiopoietin-related protein 7-like [Lucilia sericata]|uniref:angiopoietin-related protein 7-like n=1 Tax=Lucilia sericata TaxID=13632 RepID=UPI0018A80F1E|nr:angiopoietin-related protein 7-like [Lucilia sericata]